MAAPGCSSYHSSAEWGPAGCALDFSPSCLFFFTKKEEKRENLISLYSFCWSRRTS